MKIKILIVMASTAMLAACGGGGGAPNFTHAKPLPDASGVATYNCGALESDDAASALTKSHSVFVRKHYSKLVAQNSYIDELRESGTATQEQIAAVNATTRNLQAEVKAETAALGCEFKGILLGNVLKPSDI